MGCGCGKTKEQKAAEMTARLERRAELRAARVAEVAARGTAQKKQK